MEVKRVTDARSFHDFLTVQDSINRSLPNYISPFKESVRSTLSEKKNPLWRSSRQALFVAYDQRIPVGRIGAFYLEKHNEIHRDAKGYFGFFDCIDDLEVAKGLVQEASKFLKGFKTSKMIGPLNPSVNYELGVLTQGFDDKPFFMMTYNARHYASLLSSLGALPVMKFKAYLQPCALDTTKIERVASALQRRYSIQIEGYDFRNFRSESDLLCDIYNDAFAEHWAYVPFSHDEFHFVARDMDQILNRRLLFKIRMNGEVVGFILALPNMNEALEKLKDGRLTPLGLIKFLYYRRKIKWVKVSVAAIKRKYQHLGLGSILYCEMAKRVREEGYLGGELSWVADDNLKMNKVIKSMGSSPTKEYSVYELAI